jgi:hypothetical protein
MNTYKIINPSVTIGDSLSSININYLNLEMDFFTKKLSADELWSVMSDYYLSFAPFIKSAVTISQKNSAVFLSSSTTVESNSAGWIKPITIFYPSLFPSSTQPSTILTTLSSWVNAYFPTINSTTNAPNYVENQIAIIYAHSWQYGLAINENQYIRDSTVCNTNDRRVCAYCTDRYFGGTWCGTNSWADCGGRGNSCQQCGNLDCYYNSPPYLRIGSNNNTALGFISANVNMMFRDRNESNNINAIVFRIKNCIWRFDRNITSK